jgi:hypothetical protein
LALQQSPKHPGLVRRFLLHGHQVSNLTKGHNPIDPVLCSSILEDSKLLGILGGWIIWFNEELQLDPLRHGKNVGGEGEGGILAHRSRQSSGFLENLLMAMAIVWIDFAQQ